MTLYRVEVRYPKHRGFAVGCTSLDDALEVVGTSKRDAPNGTDIVLERREGSRYTAAAVWLKALGRWSRTLIPSATPRSELTTLEQ